MESFGPHQWVRDQLVEEALRNHPDQQALRQQLEDHFQQALDTAQQTMPGKPSSAPHVVVRPQEHLVPDVMPPLSAEHRRSHGKRSEERRVGKECRL